MTLAGALCSLAPPWRGRPAARRRENGIVSPSCKPIARAALVAAFPLSYATPVHALGHHSGDLTLERLGAADITRHHMRGPGCAFSTRASAAIRFVASGDRALVKIGGRTLVLRPAPKAPETFPFTFDRWIRGDLALSIRRGPVLNARGESVRQRGSLSAARRRAIRQMNGVLACGT
jgi:hypothetical protein